VANAEQQAVVARRLQESRATLEQAGQEAEDIQRALERSRTVRRRALPALRRAGLVR
jgi:predicted transcriptional regulator